MSIFDFDFMPRALLAAAFVGLAAPAVGIFIVQRRLALMGDGIGHVVLTGVAAGFLTGVAPVWTAMAAAVAGAVAIELMRERGRTSGDVALALIFYGGIAGGILFASMANETGTTLIGYLFGSVLTVTSADVTVIGGLAAGVTFVTALLRKELFAICYDEEVARASGLPVRALNIGLAVTVAVTVVVSMRVVGILLVSAMLVLPVAAVQQVTHSFRATLAGGMVLGVAAGTGGVVAAYYLDVFPAATIVLLMIAAFALGAAVGRVRSGVPS